jgi:hypothetical protein
MKRYVGAILLLAASAASGAACAAPEARVQAEIVHLLGHVAAPGCQFNRNGSWHGGAEARLHLQRKYDYLVKRNLVTSAESFIAHAATGSSMSGKPYLVKCGNGQPVASAVYLQQELQRQRAAAK